MMIRIHRLLVAVLLLACASSAFAQEEHAYTEGPVINISYIKIKPGMFDVYMKYLQTTYKQIMEEQKKAGLVVDYGVYQAFARSPKEADLYLTTTFKNWAAFDGLTDKTDAVTRKIWGSLQKSDAAAIDREKMREILGQEIVQELILK
jgi:hypothetical protein